MTFVELLSCTICITLYDFGLSRLQTALREALHVHSFVLAIQLRKSFLRLLRHHLVGCGVTDTCQNRPRRVQLEPEPSSTWLPRMLTSLFDGTGTTGKENAGVNRGSPGAIRSATDGQVLQPTNFSRATLAEKDATRR